MSSAKSKVSHSYSEPPDSTQRYKAETGPLRFESLPLSSIETDNNVTGPADKDMFVDSPVSSAVRKRMPVYPTQKRATELKSLKMAKVEKRLLYLRHQLSTTVDEYKAKPSIKETVEKITREAIDAFKNSKLPSVKESW